MRRKKKCTKCRQEKSQKEFHKSQKWCITCSSGAYKRYRHRFPLKRALICAKHRAKKTGIKFLLTYENLPRPFPTCCPILGVPLLYNGPTRHARSASIDRILPERGYRADNVAVISRRANLLKNNSTIGEIEAILNYMRAHA